MLPNLLVPQVISEESESTAMGLRESLVDTVMNAKNVRRAKEMLMEAYPTEETADAGYGMWKSVRSYILSKEEYRNFFFFNQVQALVPKAPTRKDQLSLEALSHCTLAVQHNIIRRQSKYLDDEELDAVLKTLRPVANEFYEFTCPEEISSIANDNVLQRREDTLNRAIRPPEEYVVSHEDTLSILEKCIQTVLETTTVSTKNEYYKLVQALCVITGRRVNEIMKNVIMEPMPNAYQAKVTGLSKKRSVTDIPVVIPLLMEYRDVKRALDAVRSFWDFSDVSNMDMNKRISRNSMNTIAKRFFGRKFDHTQKRNFYVEIAYRNRHENDFYPNTMKSHWAQLALGQHVVVRNSDFYQLMTVE
jgi:hypothetical protein